MDRDAFVAAVIAQLQAEESLELKAERPESALARTCRRLHVFDFPEVAEREIIALTKSITEIEASSELLFQHFRINDKFLENLNYICTHNRTHHVVQFLRSLFLTLPLYFQSCDKSQLQRYFTLEEEDKLADWSSIFRSFAAFCMTMSTSMLAACTADDRSARSSIGDSEIMKLIEFLSSLSVTLARPRKDHAGPPESKATLGGYMRAIGCASPLPDDESSACAIEVNDQPVAVDLYFHVGYLIRDLLLLNPAAIPVCMPALYNALGIVADGSIQALSDAELSMALLVIGSVIDSFNIDDTWRHGGKRAKDGAPAALLGAFLLERVGVFAAICAHFTSVSPVLHAVEQAATDANSSRQKHVFSILTSVGVMLSELDQGPKSELFDRAFVESTLLDLLQTAAFFQLHQNGGLDTRLSRLFSVLLLQYGAQAAQILLVGGGERGSVLCTMLAGGNSVMSIQGIDWAAFDDAVVRTNSAWLLSICKAHAVTLLVGLISGLIEMLSTEENIRIWLNLNGSLDSLPAIHKMLSYTVRVLIITLAPSDSDCLGGNTVRHRTTQVGDIHTSSAVLTHTLAPALFDIIHKLDKSSIHPKWFMLIFDRSACMGAEVLSDDLIGKEKLAAATALQCWVRLLNDCSTSAVVKQSVSCLEPTIDSTPRLVFRKEQLDEDSDWEWEDQKESSIELNADAQSSQIEISPPHFVATDGIADIASVQPMDYSKTTVVEQDEDTLAIDNPLREDSKPALALMSQADLNSIRRSLKIIRCTIDDIKSCGASYDGAVKKID